MDSYIEIGKEEDAELVCGGGRLESRDEGKFLQPTIFGGVSNDMRIAREEIFGPVLLVIPFKEEEDVVRESNANDYGLAVLLRQARRRATPCLRAFSLCSRSLQGHG